MERIKDWWHNRTHRHTELTKPGVGTLHVCQHRWTGRNEVSVFPKGLSSFDLLDVKIEDLEALCMATDPQELLNMALSLKIREQNERAGQ